jgi:hypothetical protein
MTDKSCGECCKLMGVEALDGALTPFVMVLADAD